MKRRRGFSLSVCEVDCEVSRFPTWLVALVLAASAEWLVEACRDFSSMRTWDLTVSIVSWI
ncbi:hypothetical protein PISMIDRAFT_507823 [Pisolithus microcarpus 441]|uniref:Unplaced genomic scaffold scaffold_565, whole genome shotgun sequence n=1 Tax=Pisolithus microcarpus 441 TaxID=765257 RepID=A0A0C9YBC7_9AGAM|nr:hypothetical protein PISMIDRAFT_507823 [Pisolithus microcarpus 441]